MYYFSLCKHNGRIFYFINQTNMYVQSGGHIAFMKIIKTYSTAVDVHVVTIASFCLFN